MISVWADESPIPVFRKLDKDIRTDVLIVGGGIAGVLCAYFLKRNGVDYVLTEADEVCRGITANTTAKITSQHGLIYSKLLREFGREKTAMYLRSNEDALSFYRELCGDIDCNFENKSNYVYTVDNEKKIEDELEALEKIGAKAEYYDRLPIPVKAAGAVKFSHQAQFNPLKFIAFISRGLNIYENSPVLEFKGKTAVTDSGNITADKIVIATHFPIINKHGSYFMKMYQHRSYVLALENAHITDGMYVDENQKGMSFRNYKNYLLIGGGGHKTGKQGGSYNELENFARKHYGKCKIKYKWAAEDCMTLDGVPYIGKYSLRTNGLYVATGFNKWGMTSAMVSAMLLTDMICGRKNPYEELYSPSRTVMRKQFFVNSLESAVSLITPTVPRCPHLGCALKWNSAERSWDCPCHGSRFAEDGKLLDNPATGNLNMKGKYK